MPREGVHDPEPPGPDGGRKPDREGDRDGEARRDRPRAPAHEERREAAPRRRR